MKSVSGFKNAQLMNEYNLNKVDVIVKTWTYNKEGLANILTPGEVKFFNGCIDDGYSVQDAANELINAPQEALNSYL